MTEPEWDVCADPDAMLRFVLGQKRGGWLRRAAGFFGPKPPEGARTPPPPSERKQRLLACACCRRLWELFADGRSRDAVEISERFADGLAGREKLEAARRAAWNAVDAQEQQGFRDILSVAWGGGMGTGKCRHWAARAAAEVASPDIAEAMQSLAAVDRAAVEWGMELQDPKRIAGVLGAKARAELVRDVFANPFRPVTADSSWCTPTVVGLARSAYEERSLPEGTLDPGRLAVLADALEEADCGDDEILGHLRSPGSHVRGCFAIDLLLNKD